MFCENDSVIKRPTFRLPGSLKKYGQTGHVFFLENAKFFKNLAFANGTVAEIFRGQNLFFVNDFVSILNKRLGNVSYESYIYPTF